MSRVSDVVFKKKPSAKSAISSTVQCFGFGKVRISTIISYSYSIKIIEIKNKAKHRERIKTVIILPVSKCSKDVQLC